MKKILLLVLCAALLLPLVGCGNDAAITIKTDYCTLRYPMHFRDTLVTRSEQVSGACAQSFYASFDGEEHRLFTVYFGGTEQFGELLGYLPCGDNVVSVSVDCGFLPEEHSLTDAQKQTYYEMMDGINTVIRSITEVSGFTENTDSEI